MCWRAEADPRIGQAGISVSGAAAVVDMLRGALEATELGASVYGFADVQLRPGPPAC
jgi:hypothetical protein